MSQRIDRIGLRTGRLLVIGPWERRKGNDSKPRIYWKCLCDCGNIVWVKGEDLQQGKTSSCGCYRSEVLKQGRLNSLKKRETGWAPTTTHGMSDTKVYRTWRRIKARCFNPSEPCFKQYGGRGITMCPEWKTSFETLYAYVGNPPSPEHSIERIDNEKGYEPGNVRWATRQEQCNNRRNTIRYNGMTIMELSHKYQVHFERLKYLLRQRKLTLAEALAECGIHLDNA